MALGAKLQKKQNQEGMKDIAVTTGQVVAKKALKKANDALNASNPLG